MNRKPWRGGDCSGFTIIEVIVTCVIIAILSTITIAGFSVWLPRYRLSTAARELYSTMQQVKITAIKQGKSCSITFQASPEEQYVAPALNNKTVKLSEYAGGVIYGKAPGDTTAYTAYPASPITMNARGLPVPTAEYRVYLTNQKASNYYMVSLGPSGVLSLKRWVSSSYE